MERRNDCPGALSTITSLGRFRLCISAHGTNRAHEPLQYSSERASFPMLARLREKSIAFTILARSCAQAHCDCISSLEHNTLGWTQRELSSICELSRIALRCNASQAICDLVSHLTRFNSGGFHYPNHGLNSSCYRRRIFGKMYPLE